MLWLFVCFQRVGQPLNENQSWRHKPLSQVCHGFVEVQSLVAKIESALWSQLSLKISAQFNGQFFVDYRQWFKIYLFSVLPRHVLWSVQETNQITNLEPSAPGHSYFPALQAVCPCWPWSLTGYLWHFPLFWLLCSHFDITQLYYYFSNCYQLSVEKPKQKLSQLTTNQNKCYHYYCPVGTESLAWSAGKHEWSKWDWFLFCIGLVEMAARVFWTNQRAK